MKNIFGDKASLVARKMFQRPDKKWVTRDFSGQQGISLGMANGVLDTMAQKGYIERQKKGPDSYSVLTNQEMLLSDWVNAYDLGRNKAYTYYSPDKNILTKIKRYFPSGKYALTLHSGANFFTHFVRTNDIHLYLNLADWEKDIIVIRQDLDLKELVRGGNVHLIKPYYKNSVFFNARTVQGYSIVSNLQLYLDLYNFHPRGREHAEELKKLLLEKGKNIE